MSDKLQDGEKIVKMNFPGNSHKEKEEEKKESTEEITEVKRVEKVTTGRVVQRKKSIWRKAIETFAGDDIKNIKSYVIWDVLIPSAKDTVANIIEGVTDAVQGSVETTLFGERRSRSRSRMSRDRGRSYVSYDSISRRDRDRDRDKDRDRRDDRRESSRNRATHNFDDILLSTREEAEEVISRLVDLIDEYDVATVADLYDLVGISSNYTDRKWGWESLGSASVSRERGGGYVMNLPKPISID